MCITIYFFQKIYFKQYLAKVIKWNTFKINNGAARETRTLMGYFPLGPQPSLSTSFSMAACAAD